MNSDIVTTIVKAITGILAVALWSALVYFAVKGAEALIFFLQSYVTALIYHTGMQIYNPSPSNATTVVKGEAP